MKSFKYKVGDIVRTMSGKEMVIRELPCLVDNARLTYYWAEEIGSQFHSLDLCYEDSIRPLTSEEQWAVMSKLLAEP